MIKMQPSLTIYAGPNGSGKTTYYLAQTKPDPNYVNADDLALNLAQAQGYPCTNALPPKLRAQIEFAAGKAALRQRTKHMLAHASFTLETTASSLRSLDLITHAQQRGYSVTVIFLYLPSVELNLARIAHRVSQGGHSVPEAVVRRRYPRAMALLPKLLSAADNFQLIDNSTTPLVVVSKKHHEVVLHPEPALGWSQKQLKRLLLGG